ncbi:MAG: L-threonylcarbamoyladenylate synthase, partial [Armatimonadota bacterium]
VVAVDPQRPDADLVGVAARAIQAGGLAAFPTETVYGLGADGLSEDAVHHLYEVKQRPRANPFILHTADAAAALSLAGAVPDGAHQLAECFWPGPLTLVLSRAPGVPTATCGGGEKVAVRVPDNAVARMLIALSDTPLAGPSANLSGSPSPVTARHVLADFEGRIDVVLDAGPCDLGLESTVIDLTEHPPRILRPGAITAGQIREVIGETAEDDTPATDAKYRPGARLVVVPAESDTTAAEVAAALSSSGEKVGLAVSEEGASKAPLGVQHIWGSRRDPPSIAARLYATLRALDEAGVDVIVAEGVPEEGIGATIMHRLRTAADEVIGGR